ncbi:hypothetical protein TNCV_3667851 [Trichonephila clavipes]|nr:hypothetical protein TNCV_3667851 [Trichonephila clavipes]
MTVVIEVLFVIRTCLRPLKKRGQKSKERKLAFGILGGQKPSNPPTFSVEKWTIQAPLPSLRAFYKCFGCFLARMMKENEKWSSAVE